MIWKVIEVHLRRLRHNRGEWLLTFFVPIAFFSIFALIFTRGVGSTPRVKVVLVQEDTVQTKQTCDTIIKQLRDNAGLKVIRGRGDEDLVDRETAESMIRRGSATIGVVIQGSDQNVSAQLLNDASDQVASQVVSALVIRAILSASVPTPTMSASSDAINDDMREFMRNVATEASPNISSQDISSQDISSQANKIAGKPAAPFKAPSIEIVNVIGEGKTNPIVSVYAAGIAVMFLLFGATSGGGVLLEERENQTLERLLASQMTMDHLLLGKWFYLTLLGFVQVTVMFIWAQLVFGLNLLGNFDGFVIMTIATAAAAASFGLFLATLCTTRGQLNGLSVVVVLTMSALGGSMVPRYVMSESLRDAGLWTFNAWALDGYDKVFWRELPPSELGPQLTVLMGTAFGLLVVARLLATRWEKN